MKAKICVKCGKFVTRYNLISHIKNNHPDIWPELKDAIDSENTRLYIKPVHYFEESSLT